MKNIPAITAAVLAAVAPCAAEPIITEFLAANDSIAVPGASPLLFADWIEIHNSDTTTVDLGGWHLTDNANNPTKWAFPAGTSLAPGAYLVVFADGTSVIDAQGFLHADFRLSAGGEFVALTRPDESVASSFGPDGEDYPDQDSDISYGVSPVNGSSVFFTAPTPGAANDPAGIAPVQDTNFSVDRGYYTTPFSVAITSETPGSTIYFTTDSSPPLDSDGTPSDDATVYSGPITISTTTVLRAAATAPGLAATDIDTQTYIFPEAVVTQIIPDGYPTAWGLESNADYDVDTEISQSATYADRFLQGLRELPTVSVSADLEDIFGRRGIYSLLTDRDLEIGASAEYFQPSTTDGANLDDGFQIDCGFKVQGNGSRRFDNAIKHSFSLRFRAIYGESKLDFPIFDEISDGQAVDSFNSLQLRAVYNNSWIHRDSDQRQRATMIRDQWMRDSFIAMGNRDGGYGDFVNLYINGLYWGVYNLHERLENDHYAEYAGLDSDGISSFNPRTLTEAPAEVPADFLALVNTIENGTWAEISAALDVDNYIDYFIMQQYGDNDDLRADSNWRNAGGGPDNAPWRLYLWDSERTLELDRDTVVQRSQDGAGFIDNLETFPEFRRRFADRAYMHLNHGGALTSLENRARFMRYVDILSVPIVGESARWGDDRRDETGVTFNRDDDWQGAVFGTQTSEPRGGVLGDWFPDEEGDVGRNRFIVGAWERRLWTNTNETWLPQNAPPQFAPFRGGEILDGTELTLTAEDDGTILFTLDGSDPADSGIVYTGGPIPLTASGVVKTRLQDGDLFSALNEATFVVEPLATPGDVTIAEINYNPDGDNSTAFVEIVNSGNRTVNLFGSSFTNGIRYTFDTALTLAPGERFVLAEDAVAFTAFYGAAPDDTFSGGLSQGGERLTFSAADGTELDSLRYDDRAPWPIRADGSGSALEASSGIVMRASAAFGGTPGAPPFADPGVVINEVLAHTDPPLTDQIELKNTTTSPIDISGWFLSDSTQQYKKFQIPSGNTIPAGGYVVFDENDFNVTLANTITGYSGTVVVAPTTVTVAGAAPLDGTLVTISGYGGIGNYNGTYEVTNTGASTFTIDVPFLDDVATKGTWTPGQPFALSSEQGETLSLVTPGVAAFSDSVTFGASFNAESFARSPDGTGVLLPATTRTFGAANTAAPRIGPVVITEIYYDTATPFIEIYNSSDSQQSLENWSLRGNVDLDFAASASLAPGEIALLAATSSVPGAPAGTQVFVWDNGDVPLGFSGGDIRLRQPDTVSADDPTFFPQVVSDESIFITGTPWLAAPGASLQRNTTSSPGSDPGSWAVALPTPGVFNTSTFANFASANGLSGIATEDTDGDGIPDLGEYALGLDPNAVDPSPIAPVPGTLPTFFTDPTASGVSTVLESSANLNVWSTALPAGIPEALFYRLRFTVIQ